MESGNDYRKKRDDFQDGENTLCAVSGKEVEAARKPGTSPTEPTVPRQKSIVNPERRAGQVCRDRQRAVMRSCGWWDTKRQPGGHEVPGSLPYQDCHRHYIRLSWNCQRKKETFPRRSVNKPSSIRPKRAAQKNDDVKRIAMPRFCLEYRLS